MKNEKIQATLNTAGSGLWTARCTPITHDRMEISYINEESNFGELRVFFNVADWNIRKHGLIYTDYQWLREFKAFLSTIGYSDKAARGISYSEQGMQGENFVSLDIIGADFIKEFLERNKG